MSNVLSMIRPIKCILSGSKVVQECSSVAVSMGIKFQWKSLY